MSSEETSPTPEEKQKAHFTKTKKAALKLAADNGGSCSMADMHKLTESQFFVAHQRFSMMLEECVADGLVTVDGSNTIALTEKGRAFVGEAIDHG